MKISLALSATLMALMQVGAQAGKESAASHIFGAPGLKRTFKNIPFAPFLDILKAPNLDGATHVTALKAEKLKDVPILEESLPLLLQAAPSLPYLAASSETEEPGSFFKFRRVAHLDLDSQLAPERTMCENIYGKEACQNFVTLELHGLARPKLKSVLEKAGRVDKLVVEDYLTDVLNPFTPAGVEALTQDLKDVKIFRITGQAKDKEGENRAFEVIRDVGPAGRVTFLEVEFQLCQDFVNADAGVEALCITHKEQFVPAVPGLDEK